MEPLLSLSNIRYTYEGDPAPAIRDIHISIGRGEWVAVIGPNGSGKSTLCRVVSGFAAAHAAYGVLEGSIILRGSQTEVEHYSAIDAAGRIGSVSQDAETGIVMDIVEDELAFGPENLLVSPEHIDERIDAALTAVGLPVQETRGRRVAQLSGGQQQRVAIAAVHAMEPELFVFDDAAANLDAAGAERVAKTLQRLHREGHALLTAAPRWDGMEGAERLILLAEGRIIADGPTADVLSLHRETLQRLGCLPAAEPPLPPASPRTRTRRRASSGSPVFRSCGAQYAYPASGAAAMQFPEVELGPGDIAAVAGPNGSGKTTFGKLIAGLLPAPSGAFLLRGHDLAASSEAERARCVGYVFQQPHHQFVAETVFDECAFGLRMRRPNEALTGADIDAVEAQLLRFGLQPLRERHPLNLPVSQQRLVNLAAALLLDPILLVLDEPTAGMDYATADHLMRHVSEFAASGGAALVITHDDYVVQRWTTRTIPINA